ncbi:uncharacterized protein LOC120351606 [Nilaparvata lugens]|uniref:uncharacterized protein LOC120351606 n=1 Tax=Nilaparvata lugens TaxID=108931 RepID=UPI00193C86C2|nr:uncharacterized protein LOC120351606 [Nilaparvata lugens]
MCIIRLKGRFRNVTFVSVYAPTEDADEQVKEDFYDMLTSKLEWTSQHDMVLVLGDLNAQVGRESALRSVAGEYSLHEESNSNGFLVAQFAESSRLIIRSTCFPHKRIHLGAWKAPGTEIVNQIDHVLVSTRHASGVLDVRTMRGPNCDSDHFMVRAVIRFRLANICKENGVKRCKWDVSKLRMDRERQIFQNDLDRKFGQSEMEEADVNVQWKRIQSISERSAKETIGVEKMARNQEWFDRECEEAIRERNDARNKMLQRDTREARANYNLLRRRAKSILRSKKREAIKQKILLLQTLSETNQSKKLYKEVNWFRKGFQARLNGCKDKNGHVVSNEMVLNRWTEHFEEVLNEREEDGQPSRRFEMPHNVDREDEETAEPTIQELERAIAALKNNKAPGEDGILSEMIKSGGDRLKKELYGLIVMVWREEKMPDDWKTSMISPIFKKGDKMVFENYRGISLLSIAYKAFTNILLQRLTPFAEAVLGDYQGGFRKGRSTVDQIFTLR